MELPGMSQGLLDEEQDSYHAVKNLDLFYTSMYNYYAAKGLPHIILIQLSNVVSLGFTVSFSVFLIGFVKWHALFQCHDEGSCGIIGDYVSSSAFSDHSLLFGMLLFTYVCLIFLFWVWQIGRSVTEIISAVEMERFYVEKLGVSLQELSELEWHEIMHRLIALHEHGVYRVSIKEKLTEHDVVLRIMRKENYLIGMFNKRLLHVQLPWFATAFMSEHPFLTKSLEWSISYCVLDHMFNEQFHISQLFLRDAQALQNRLFFVGMAHLIFMPFMLIFITVQFFLSNASQFHTSKAFLGPRQWSPLALWTFREFNELPHVFEERINKSYAPANEYLGLFHNSYLAIVASLVSYISGSFVATLLLVSVISEGVLLYVLIADHNLFWYLGIFSAIFAGSRALIPDQTSSGKTRTPEELVTHVASHTHYFPLEWTNKCHTLQVKDQISELFQFKVQLFAMEVMSVVLTPLVLCWSLPECGQSVIDFVRDHSKIVDGVGAVCDYSLFDFTDYGDEQYGAAVAGVMNISQKLLFGKLEQSFLNFQKTYPNWDGDLAGKAMIARLNGYRQYKEADRDNELTVLLQQSLFPGMNLSHSQVDHQRLAQSQDQEQYDPSKPGSSALHLHVPPAAGATPWGPAGYSALNPLAPLRCISEESQENNDVSSDSGDESPTAPKHVGIDIGSPPVLSSLSDVHTARRLSEQATRRTTNTHNNLHQPRDHNDLPSVLRSVLKQQNIDYENDFYWLTKFQQDRAVDPTAMEQSMNLIMQQSHNNESILCGSSLFGRSFINGRGARNTAPIGPPPSFIRRATSDIDISSSAAGLDTSCAARSQANIKSPWSG